MTQTLLVFILLLTACGEMPKRSNTGRGYVRNIWMVKDCFNVTFEREDGMTFTYDFVNVPPVWSGMHATIDYTYTEGSWPCEYTAHSVQRWP